MPTGESGADRPGGGVQSPSSGDPAAPSADAASADEEHGEAFKAHTVSVLTRVVSEERSDDGPAVGLDYEFRFHERVGVGAFAEYVAGELEVGVFGLMLNVHPTDRLLLGIGPGVETNELDTDWLIRVGGL